MKKYVVVYYKNEESGKPGKAVHQSKAFDRVSFPEHVSVINMRPRELEWDYAVIEERFYWSEGR